MTNQELPLEHRIIYSSWDFQQALSALTFLCEECEFEKQYSREQLRRFRCFETTTIVAFSRPFKPGGGRKGLDLESIGFELTEDELKLKDKVLGLRDKVVGHSDKEYMEYRTYSFTVFDDSELRMPAIIFRESLYLDEDDYDSLDALLHRLIHAISKYQFEFAQSNPKLFEQLKIPVDS